MEKQMRDYKHNYPLYEVTHISSIREMMEIAVREAGERTAFKYFEGKGKIASVTYSEFMKTCQYLGSALCELGVASEHVACIGENSYKWITAYLAMLMADGVFVPVDRELPADNILNVLNSSDSVCVFCDEKYEKIFRENEEAIPNIKYVISFSAQEHDGKYLSYAKLVERGRELMESGYDEYTKIKTDTSKLKFLVYTSGTTGTAKGVMLSEHNIVSCIYHGMRVATVSDCCLSVLPYHHTYEAVAGILVGIHKKVTICINDSLKNVAKNLQVFAPTYILVVPAFAELFYKKITSTLAKTKKDKLFKVMVAVSNFLRFFGIDLRRKIFKAVHKNFGGNLTKMVCGGAPLSSQVAKFFDDIGILILNGYGITECSPLISVNREYFNDYRTTGIHLPCIEVKIDNVAEDGNGEICVKGDTVMMGYYKMPEQTADVLRDGWFYTGDYGRINERGQLLITGRKKNLIVLKNGKNIYPEEIEGYIAQIPYVAEVIVSAVKDEDGQEISLCAEVFLSQEALGELGITEPEKVLRADITKACEELPTYKKVTDIVIRDKEFEKTTSKKIKRKYN